MAIEENLCTWPTETKRNTYLAVLNRPFAQVIAFEKGK
jgi:hypothetical protein